MECCICMESIEYPMDYQLLPTSAWKPFFYCQMCFQYQIDHQWSNYIKKITTSTCDQSLQRLLKLGSPIYFQDTLIEQGQSLFSCRMDDKILSTKLKCPLNDETHDAFTFALQSIVFNDHVHDNVFSVLTHFHVHPNTLMF